ncbi:peptide chain release factor N(5)-glutamine methyltransferase [Candidatus Parcubacteria bacterium]|nr:peptide chain release factor N(5)-glutamine methyltransferase [Candidatus Parcubacteria bacterium]
MNIHQSLKISTNKLKLQNIPSADLDAEVLLLEALNRSRYKKLDKSWLYINDNYELNKNEEKLFNSFINQRLKNKPVAYIINRKEFYGYDFYVDENVLIPRPETEFIVEEVLKILNPLSPPIRLSLGAGSYQRENSDFTLIDIGTGSGCIIISVLNELAKRKGDDVVENAYANDISLKAIKIAKRNANKYNLNKKIKFVANDFEKFLNKKNIYNSDELVITANLPYIKNDDYKNLSKNIKKYEPKIALAAGKDGLVYIEKLVDSVLKIKKKYKQKIYVLIEADPNQMSKITAIINKKSANARIKIIKDLSGKKRIAVLSYC